MKENLIYILTFIYGIGGIITFTGFIPTMIDLWKKKPSANIITYIVWSAKQHLYMDFLFFKI